MGLWVEPLGELLLLLLLLVGEGLEEEGKQQLLLLLGEGLEEEGEELLLLHPGKLVLPLLMEAGWDQEGWLKSPTITNKSMATGAPFTANEEC